MKTKNIVTAIVTVALICGGTSIALADTSSSTATLITQLQQQIADLTAKLATLTQAQHDAQAAQQNITGTLALLGNLKEGMTGDQVALLQTSLASDTSIYPEGAITGYYGSATKEAVKRFQRKYGISATGFVGPLTIARINQFLRSLPVMKNQDNNNNGNGNSWGQGTSTPNAFCLSIPPGHQIAPGWLKHNHGKAQLGKGNDTDDDFILPRCKNLPNGTTTPPVADITAPVTSSIAVLSITDTGAHVTWTTNEQSRSKIFVGTTSPVSTTSAPTQTDNTLVTGHNVPLTGLSANTTYYFVIQATDIAGNTSTSAQSSFATLVTPDVTPPVISALLATSTGSTIANVSWTTNEAAGSAVYYGTTSPLNVNAALSVFAPALVTAHSVNLSGLSTTTTYYTIVVSKDAANNTATSTETSFATGS